MRSITGKKNPISMNDFKIGKELLTEEQARSFNETISRTIAGDGTAALIKNGFVPTEIKMADFHFELIKDAEHVVYKARNEENFNATITYRKRRKEFHIEMLPGYKDLNGLMCAGRQP